MPHHSPVQHALNRHCGEGDCRKLAHTAGLCMMHYKRQWRASRAVLLPPREVPAPLPDERWLPIPGYEGRYEASNQGRVRSVDRVITDALGRVRRLKGALLRPAVCRKRGHVTHLSVSLGDGNPKHVHRLIRHTFVGAPPPGMEGCHNNGNPQDNRVANLRWDTRSSNHLDMQRHGTDVYRNREVCPRGHRLAGANLKPSVFAQYQHRVCLACSRANNMKHYYLRTYGAGVRSYDFAVEADRYYAKLMQ